MEIKSRAKNGTITCAVKAYPELTEDERNYKCCDLDHKEEFKDFTVNRKKDGTLLKVKGHDRTEKAKAEIEEGYKAYRAMMNYYKSQHRRITKCR